MRELTDSEKDGVMRQFEKCLNNRTCKYCYEREENVEAKFCRFCGSQLEIKETKWVYDAEKKEG